MQDLKQKNGNLKYYSNSRAEMIGFIPDTTEKLLDIGCGYGYFGLSVKKKFNNIEIWGIEINQDAGLKAKENLDNVLINSIEKALDNLPDQYFNCIVFNDVLEHLVDPYEVLEKIKKKISPNGVILCSIPNVRHRSVLFQLLVKKDWKYSNDGVLDRTHLRFFTMKSITRMFQELNYKIIKIKGINIKLKIIFFILNILSFGYTNDIGFKQIICIAKLNDNSPELKNLL